MKKIIIFLMILLLPSIVNAKENVDTVTLSQCVDGNSARFMLGSNEIKVRFIGIEAFEVVNTNEDDETNGSYISDYVCETLKEAKIIKLEYDENSEEQDSYGRTYAWVFVDDTLLQEDLVTKGYAKVAYIYGEYKYNETIENAQKKAQEEHQGEWKEEEKQDEKENEPEKEKKKNILTIIWDFICEMFDKLLKFIDDIINDIL